MKHPYKRAKYLNCDSINTLKKVRLFLKGTKTLSFLLSNLRLFSIATPRIPHHYFPRLNLNQMFPTYMLILFPDIKR